MTGEIKIREVEWREAEAFIGHRLDRRRSYAIGPHPVTDKPCLLSVGRWTRSCSGCCEGGEYGGMLHHYPWDTVAGCHVGSGCEECGYTGKRREEMWLPHVINETQYD